MQFCKKNIGR